MIAILDSGIGGFQILHAISKHYPNLDIFYHANTTNFPFGTKTDAQLYKILQHAYEECVARNVSHIILACNTASAVSINHFGKAFKDIPILDLISVYQEAIANISDPIILCTKLNKTLLSKMPEFEKMDIVAPVELATLIEENFVAQNFAPIKKYLQTLDLSKKTILHACTHFQLIADLFAEVFQDATFIDPAPLLLKNLNLSDDETGTITFSDPQMAKKYDAIKNFL